MGNYHPRPIRFRQSLNDFPLTVSLGEKVPSWGLSRWDGGGLRFIPPDDEGFVLRGDTRRLVYKGRRRSHRFTILGNAAFEYDCILEKEPESNVISLLMDGAEQFDFLRQPDFVQDPFLKGSYAVYKKETLLGEGTGKLCHIHRPEIIDARGRRVWGGLTVIGNELCIAIPEWFLSEAVYPVVVDPTIGTTTVGSQYLWDADPPEPMVSLMLEGSIGVNRFLVSETINGTCTAYIYTNEDDYDAGGQPVIYSDNGNIPLTRKSKNENWIDFRVTGGKSKGWRNGTFQTNGSITGGSYIWFGVFADFFWFPRFDYGAKCYRDEWYNIGDSIPNTYPLYNASYYDNFKLSMYFTYTTAQNYTRTLTQGITLTDTRKLTGTYKRTSTQTVKGTTVLGRMENFYRKCLMDVQNTAVLKRSPVFVRTAIEQLRVTMGMSNTRNLKRNVLHQTTVHCSMTRRGDSKRTIANTESAGTLLKRSAGINLKLIFQGGVHDGLSRAMAFSRFAAETLRIQDGQRFLRSLVRNITEQAHNSGMAGGSVGFKRSASQTLGVQTAITRHPVFVRKMLEGMRISDVSAYSVVWLRHLKEQEGTADTVGHWGNYLRGLSATAGSLAEAGHTGTYYRKNIETVQADGQTLRHLFIFIHLVTVSFVRDFIIRRFLKSNEELVLKSCVCREIILDSNIH